MKKTPIYVIAGQSNANNKYMVEAVEARVKAEGGVLVFHAVNGTSLSPYLDVHGNGDWSPGPKAYEGELLGELSAKISAAAAGGQAELAGMIWIQGETDGRSDSASRGYADRLLKLHDGMVEKFGAHQMVVAGLSDDISTFRGDSAKTQESWDRVRAAQIHAGETRSSILVFQPDDFAKVKGFKIKDMFREDLRHYETDFAVDLGLALYDVAKLPSGIQNSNGGAGSDRLLYNGKFDVFIAGGDGQDTLVFTVNSGVTTLIFNDSGTAKVSSHVGVSEIGVSSIEKLATFSGNDRVHMAGTLSHVATASGRDTVLGSERADDIWLGDDADYGYGHAGKDRLFGGNGNDSLYGGHDDDVLQGQAGNDVLDLGAGNDIGSGGAGHDRIAGQAGNDDINGGEGQDSLYGLAGQDKLNGAAGDDVMDGGSGNDLLWGGDGRDAISGDDGSDGVWAGSGNDIIRGGFGNDTLHGGAGNDTMRGGPGNDMLTGAQNADVFVLDGGRDFISDFDSGEDVLVFLSDAEIEMSLQGGHTVIEWQAGAQGGTVTVMGVNLLGAGIEIEYW